MAAACKTGVSVRPSLKQEWLGWLGILKGYLGNYILIYVSCILRHLIYNWIAEEWEMIKWFIYICINSYKNDSLNIFLNFNY